MANNLESFSVDGIQLDRDNQEFMMALEYALYTNASIYLTGKAGSGKTTFLKYLREVTEKNMVVLAPTGLDVTRPIQIFVAAKGMVPPATAVAATIFRVRF